MASGDGLPSMKLQGLQVLVVEDDSHCRVTLERLLRHAGGRVRSVETVQEALLELARPTDLIILDVALPDGSGVRVAEAASRLRPPPRVIATSANADPADSFELARLHVQQFLRKPYDVADLGAAIERLRSPVEELADASARAVGELGLLKARDVVRDSMVEEALTLAEGNRTQAARMLGVTRQAVQSAMRS